MLGIRTVYRVDSIVLCGCMAGTVDIIDGVVLDGSPIGWCRGNEQPQNVYNSAVWLVHALMVGNHVSSLIASIP